MRLDLTGLVKDNNKSPLKSPQSRTPARRDNKVRAGDKNPKAKGPRGTSPLIIKWRAVAFDVAKSGSEIRNTLGFSLRSLQMVMRDESLVPTIAIS